MGKITKALNQLLEKHSASANEYVMHLGDIDGASRNLVFMEANLPNIPHYHTHSDSIFLIISGTGEILCGDKYLSYQPGDVVKVPKTVLHQILPQTDSLMLTIQNPAHRFSGEGWSDTVYPERENQNGNN